MGVAVVVSGTGEGLEKGDPRLTLREWAITERQRNRGHLPAFVALSAIGRAWTAFARGEDLRQIKIMRRPTRENLEVVGFHAPAA